ncbi:hypothetical protein [Brevundimonas subvibrioides]|uniref:Uncharacterized protein n=1 Tax=Brevundimonas subvibrioides (strain ATCC 15264 / DSM 4735 / LMG 14903 / NBRC 16000 / CB 81) TaxID=633149 RepID=D9QHS4_BRESC|nr:hypothetical protein [Brevundimonas subvibrioides]ADK99349.1 conserved hypothetical protein [Brevundimonas subvibrioides ATCC 15264]
MSDRAVRSLENLERSASTARVLNLLKISREHRHTAEWREAPLFQTPALNACLLVKHRLRRNEIDSFRGRRQIATKVIVPIDNGELKSGGRYVFVNQINFEMTLMEVFGIPPEHPDVTTLRLIDKLPSLDPFLLREQLRRSGIDPAPCYFALSEADLQNMLNFVKAEITPLVALSMGGASGNGNSIERMASKILSNAGEDGMDALGQTLRLNPEQYQEGVFCWKGFLYYKWSLRSMTSQISEVADRVASVKPVGPVDQAARDYIARGRHVLRARIVKTCAAVRATLQVYDEAYASLTRDGNPSGFRDFLLEAPSLFARLGDQLGAIQHIVSFWTFRFGPHATPAGAEELMDIFMDFETGLRGRDETEDAIAA